MNGLVPVGAREISAELPPEPFPGLRPFNPDEWGIFFGREPMIDEVIRLLAGQHLVVVHGASGCGKSSLVRAGVLPWLALDHAASGVPWRTAIARPAGGPLRNIAAELGRTLGPPPGGTGDRATAWHDRLALGQVGLPDIQAALDAAGASLCLLVDQFEELFRWARQNREEARLVAELLRLTADGAVPRLFVILTMRSDYLGACAGYEGFAETVNRCQYLLPRMDDFGMLRAIHEPASLFSGTIANEVADRLLFEAGREQDPLPVLQHTLTRACRDARRKHGSNKRWIVTTDSVSVVEGAEGALAAHAEEVLTSIEDPDGSRLRAAEWVFRTITDLDAEGRLVRRPRKLGELVEVAGNREGVLAVVEAFRSPDCSFLTSQPSGELGVDTEIDIGHEALIRRWPRLADDKRDPVTQEPAGWIWREFEDGLRWRALAVQAQAFKNDPSATLSPATTESYGSWWPKHNRAWAARYSRDGRKAREEYNNVEDLWRASEQALAAEHSHLEVERNRVKKERSLRRRAEYFAWVAGTFMLLCICALAAVAWFYLAVKSANQEALAARNRALAAEASAVNGRNRALAAENSALTEKNSALDAKNLALQNESRLLARIALATIESEGPVTAALLALRGLPQRFQSLDRPIVAETADALEAAIGAQAELSDLLHNGPVNSAVFSSDGAQVLTASSDKTAQLWDAASGTEQRTLRGHRAEVLSAVFSSDGAYVLTASSDKTARLWGATSGTELRILLGHQGAVVSAVFSLDGARVLTASNDGTARLWDAANGAELRVLRGHDGAVGSAVFSPDKARVLTASDDNTARLWDAASGAELHVLRGHRGRVYSAAFSPDGTRVVTASADNTARLWDADSGTEIFVLRGHEGRVYSAVFSPNGGRVLTASEDDTARLWDTASGAELSVLRGHMGRVRSAVFSPDGARVLTTSYDKTARVWDSSSGAELRVLRGHEDWVNSAVFSPDAARVLTTSSDRTARLWDAVSSAELRVLRGHEGPVHSVMFSPDGARVLTASYDNTARLWDATSGAELRVLRGHEGAVVSAVFAPDGAQVLTVSDDKTARLWDATSGAELRVFRGHEGPVYSAAFSPDGARVLTASSDSSVRLWDAASGTELCVIRLHEASVVSAVFSPDGKRVLTASDDNNARLWDAANGAETHVLRGHEGRVNSAVFSPDGTRVLTASDDNSARLWDAANGAEMHVLRGHYGPVYSALFSLDGARVLTASDDNTARLWDAASGAELRVLRVHEGRVFTAIFSPDGTRVLTASDDQADRLWDAASGTELRVLRGQENWANAAAFSPDGARVLTASADNAARLWETWPTVRVLVEEARRRMPRQLTPEQEEHFGLRRVAAPAK